MRSYPRYCPQCNADFRDKPIPQEYIDKGWYSAEDPWYYRIWAMYDEKKDRTVAYMCPDCRHRWERE